MAKEKQVTRVIKLQIQAAKANPAPPVGPALGQAQVNIQEFCQRFNDATKEMVGNIVPVVITVYDDRSYTFVLKTPPASGLLKKAAGITSGSKKGNKEIVATITSAQVRAIAEQKMPDLNANDVEAGMRIIEGTAKNMGIAIEN